MQSNTYIVFALILSTIGVLISVALFLNPAFILGEYTSGIGIIISVIGLVFAAKSTQIVKTPLASFGIILSVIGIVLNIIILIHWIACIAFDFIATNTAAENEFFKKIF